MNFIFVLREQYYRQHLLATLFQKTCYFHEIIVAEIVVLPDLLALTPEHDPLLIALHAQRFMHLFCNDSIGTEQ